MTIDLSTLKAGDTIELRCGGRIITDETLGVLPDYIRLLIDDSTMLCWTKDGVFIKKSLNVQNTHPFDIVAIHKKPKPVEITRTVQFKQTLDGKFVMTDSERPPENVYVTYRITFLPETKDLKLEVVS